MDDATNSEANECNYCGECAHLCDPLIVVCACKTRPVHASCLQRWIRTRPHTGAARFQCEVCHSAYMNGRVEFTVVLLLASIWLGVCCWWEKVVKMSHTMFRHPVPTATIVHRCAHPSKDKMSDTTAA